MSLYQRIREESRKKYGTEAERLLDIIINQYSDRTHFIYEILQNAEDAGANNICFHLKKAQLIIYHDGRPFNEKDIEGVCGIANGTKNDGTRIGHFGIGFKSVYCYTEEPVIYSGDYHFRIKDQLFPEEVPGLNGLPYEKTCMVLPFNKKEVSDTTAFKEIRNALSEKISAESILVLNNISNIIIQIEGESNVIHIEKEKNPLGTDDYRNIVYALSIYTTIDNKELNFNKVSESHYLFFTDAKKEPVALIYKVDGKTLVPVKNSKIYAYFPTAKESHQNFFIHAPFDTTPARDNFKKGAEYGKHNFSLVDSLGDLMGLVFPWLRDHGYLTPSGLNTVFPIFEYEKDDVLYGIYKKSIEIMGKEALFPTNDPSVFKSIKDICMPLYGVIVDSFDDNDLRKLSEKRNVSWISKEFSTDSFRGIRDFMSKHFKYEVYDWKDLVLKMNDFFLAQKSQSWMSSLMSRIESYCIKRDSGSYSHYIDVSKIPFVRTTEGRQITARDQSNKLQVYLNNPDIAKYRIESSFVADSNIRRFYYNVLGIPEYDIVQETINSILPKYENSHVNFVTDNHMAENMNDLKVIKNALYSNAFLIDQVRNSFILTDGNSWFRPTSLYIRSNDTRTGYSLVEGRLKFDFLSDEYFDTPFLSFNLDEDFFRSIGCNLGLMPVSVSKEAYLSTVKQYLDKNIEFELRKKIFGKNYVSNKFNWAFYFEGFNLIFKDMSKNKSLEIARFLNIHAMEFDVHGELVGADDKHFSGKNVDSMMAYSMIGLYLCFEKWIYIDRDDKPHSPLEVDKDEILDVYAPFKRILSLLPFKEEKNLLSEWLSSAIDKQSDIDLVKHYFSTPEEIVKMAKLMAKNDAKEESKKKNKSIKDLIEEGDREQQEIKKSTPKLEVNPISEKAMKRRQQNLDKEMAESLDHFTKISKGLHFGSRLSNQEERLFLEQEYDGRCQICLKQINKYNGDRYFEAINFIRYSQLPDNFESISKYAWNSLCLCPNCAAEFNYSSKKVSDFYDQVMNTEIETGSEDPIEIGIELPMGEKQIIMYSPRHFLALKRAFNLFNKQNQE